MPTTFATSSRTRTILVVTAALCLAAMTGGCRRSSSKNANANGPSATNEADAERSRREAKSLVDKGKVLSDPDHNQDEQAVQAFQEAIRLQPDLAEAHLRLGMAYAALDKKTEAEASYKKAIELYKKVIQADAKDADAFFNLGQAHSFLHQDEEASRSYRQATRLRGDDEEAFYQLGRAETKLAHYPEATAAFQKALDLDPDDSRAVEALDNAREGSNRIKEGKKHAEEMLKKQQDNANANGNANSNSRSRPSPKPGIRRF
jgi:tetratricopeptide (TPR) repeat protein